MAKTTWSDNLQELEMQKNTMPQAYCALLICAFTIKLSITL